MPTLQKDLNLNPTITSVGSPVAGPNDPSQAIASVGNAVKSFVTEKKKDALTEELKTLGDEVFAVNTGKEIKSVTDRISRLKDAKDQGALTNTMVKIETETILREAIDSMPAFGPELRRHAASILGFDPTGAQIRALLDAPLPQEENDVYQGLRETAEAIEMTTGVPSDITMKLQGQALFAQQQANLITEQATIGNAGRREILNATAQEADGHISAFMGDLIGGIRQGGIVSPETTTAELQARVLGHKQALRDRYNAVGINPDSAELARDMAVIDEQWSPLFQLAEDGSLANILDQNAKAIASAMTIEGYNVMADIALMNEVAGQEGVKHYFLTLDKYGKSEQLELLKQTNPVLARNVETINDAKKLAAKAYKRVMGVSPAFADSPFQSGSAQPDPALDAMEERVFYDTVTNAGLSDVEKQRRLSYAKQHGQKFKVMGAYFQKGGRGAASPEEVKFVTQTFEEEYPQMVDRLIAEVASDGNWKVEVHNGQLRVNTPTFGQIPGGGPGVRGVPGLPDVRLSSTVESDLKRLNSFDRGIKNGWSNDLKQNPNSFLQETAARINGEIDKIQDSQENLNAAIEAFEQNPSPENLEALRAIDPELVSDVERNLKGADNNAE